MGIMVYSLFWVVQDFVHQPYLPMNLQVELTGFRVKGLGFRVGL